MKKKYNLCSKNIIVLALAFTMAWPHTLVANPSGDGSLPPTELKNSLPVNSLGAVLGVDKLSPEEAAQKELFASVQQADFDVDGVLQHRTVDYLQGSFSSEDFESFVKVLETLQPEIEKSLKQNPNASFKIRYIDADERNIEKEIPYTQIQRILKWSKRSEVQVYNPDEATKSLLRTLTFGIFSKTTRTDVKFALARFFVNGALSTISITLSHHPLQVGLTEGIFLGAASACFALFRQYFSEYVNRADTKFGELVRWGVFEIPFVGSLLAIDAYYGLYPDKPAETFLMVTGTILLSIFSQGNGDTIIIDRAKVKLKNGREDDDRLRAQRLAAEKQNILEMTDKQFGEATNKAEYRAVRNQQVLTTLNSVTSVVIAALKTAAENTHVSTLVGMSYVAYVFYGGFGWAYVSVQRLKSGERFRDLFNIRRLFVPKSQLPENQDHSLEGLTCQQLFG